MIKQLFNWRSILGLIAIIIVTGTIFYSQYLARKIEKEERQKVEQWVAASKAVVENPGMNLELPNLIRNEQNNIPIIETNELDSITNFVNLDTLLAVSQPQYLANKLKEFKKNNEPLQVILSKDPLIMNKYYYGNTRLLKEVQYYPLIQLLLVSFFIAMMIGMISARNKSTQNQVWAGMAKETAHQLGTPLSSLEGWVEMLKEEGGNEKIVTELEKDVERLKLVSDRFSKIGSTPKLEPQELISQINSMVTYMRKRATGKVVFQMHTGNQEQIYANISAPLFDWVIENLLKNALDAMEGKGSIDIFISEQPQSVQIDIKDSGKGIAAHNIHKVFKPGFTTKKRGWGLGLSLSKRIIEQFHNGSIQVAASEPGMGTTFSIILPKK